MEIYFKKVYRGKQAGANIRAHLCMLYQRGRKFVFLLEQEKFVLELEISCWSTNILCPSTNFVPEHKLCALAQNVCARA